VRARRKQPSGLARDGQKRACLTLSYKLVPACAAIGAAASMEYQMRNAMLLVLWFATTVAVSSTALPARAGLEPAWTQFVTSTEQKAKSLRLASTGRLRG